MRNLFFFYVWLFDGQRNGVYQTFNCRWKESFLTQCMFWPTCYKVDQAKWTAVVTFIYTYEVSNHIHLNQLLMWLWTTKPTREPHVGFLFSCVGFWEAMECCLLIPWVGRSHPCCQNIEYSICGEASLVVAVDGLYCHLFCFLWMIENAL